MVNVIDMSVQVLIFASLVGVVAGFITTAVANTTGATSTLIGLVTIFFTIAFIRVITKQAGASK